MYRTLEQKTLRAVVIGTSLAVLPAVPFYIYTFDASLYQLAILVPLFIPALIAMLTSDVIFIRLYLRPIREFYGRIETGSAAPESTALLARRRALNFPVFGVARVFGPHAVIGSGVFNLCIIVANKYLALGINPGDFLMYWVINLTVVPVAHAVYEYFEFSKVMIPTLQSIESTFPSLQMNPALSVVSVRLATKVIIIFIMLGMAPLFILGVSLNKKQATLLVEKEEHHLVRKAQMLAAMIPSLSASQRKALLLSANSEEITLLVDSAGTIQSSDAKLFPEVQGALVHFAGEASSGSAVYRGGELLAARAETSDGKVTVVAAVLTSDLMAAASSLRYGTVSIIIVSIVLLAVLLILVAKDINRSTKTLLAGLKKVEEGSLDHEVKVYSTDEFSTIGEGINRMVGGLRERNFIKDTFGKYVAPTVMEKILHDSAHTAGFRLSGERRKVTILMSDIRDFTRRTERSSAEEIVELLNAYLERMVGVVERYDGVVDKYIGDALMVLFGAPIAKPEDADRAVRAAFAMREELVRLNKDLKAASPKNYSPVRIGIGIHTGEVVAGSIGSANRLEYTVIGDAVNLASRIEGLTKLFKTDILVSAETVMELKGTYPLAKLPRTHVKGKKGEVTVYKAGPLRRR